MARYTYPTEISSGGSYLSFTRLKNNGFTTAQLKSIDQYYVDVVVSDLIALPFPNSFIDSTGISYTDVQDTSITNKAVGAIAQKVVGDTALQQVKGLTGKKEFSQNAQLFDGVSTKTYNMSWDLIPESLNEAQQIENIIKQFTLASLPVASDQILNFPDLIKVKMKGTKSDLVHFLPCVITNVEYNPTPQNHFQIYDNGGHFPHIQFSITLQEIVGRNRNMMTRLYS